jgi:2'-5' RNA ligase
MEEMRTARVFLAVGISPAIAGVVEALARTIGRGAPAGLFRFVDAGQAHITLRFLGQRSDEEQTRIVRAAAAAAAGVSPFSLAVGGLGVFPDERRPHTLWMGLTKGRPELIALAARLDLELHGAGFAPEGRPYVPHLTLARIKQRPPSGLMRKIVQGEIEGGGGTIAIESNPTQSVGSFAMMESRASPGGVRYVPLQIFRLETACTPSK